MLTARDTTRTSVTNAINDLHGYQELGPRSEVHRVGRAERGRLVEDV
jgi:hypothetical protein